MTILYLAKHYGDLKSYKHCQNYTVVSVGQQTCGLTSVQMTSEHHSYDINYIPEGLFSQRVHMIPVVQHEPILVPFVCLGAALLSTCMNKC